MRKPILLLLPLAVACGEAAAPEVLIPGFRENATRLTCEAVDLGIAPAATEIRRAADSLWTVLDAPSLELLTFTDRFDLLTRTPLPDAGPGAARHAVSAGLLGDSAVVVAARDGLRLVFLTPAGEFLRSEPLDFIPNSLAVAPSGQVLLTPVPYGDQPPTLLMRYARGEWAAVPVPRRPYADMSINAFGNTALVEPLPGGGLLVMHQFMAPRAFLVDANGRVEARIPPTPDFLRDHIGFIPRPPITDDQIPRILVPAIAMSVDPNTGEVYVMTRATADNTGSERTVLRLDERLEFGEGYIVPVRAGGMVYLPRRRALLVVDQGDRFHLCALPTAAAA